jgi:dTDP-4-dehydrorhamnose reductase
LVSTLIVGADSEIGSALAGALVRRGDAVIGTTRRRSPASHQFFLDLAAPDAASADLPQADVVVFCAAIAKFSECRNDPDRAYRVDVATPVALARRLTAAGTRVVLLSTSAVFDGRVPHRRADDATCPKSAYGRFKAKAEAGLLDLGTAASVLRLTKVIAPRMPLFAGWAENLRRGYPIRAFSDLYFCPIGLHEAVEALLTVIDDQQGGIYQVSGGDDLSYAEAAHYLAHWLNADPGSIETGLATDHGVPCEEILRHTSLDTRRLSALTGFSPRSPQSVLTGAWSAHAAGSAAEAAA